MQRYYVAVAEIQETKWFGLDVWPVGDDWSFLHFGQLLPPPKELVSVTKVLKSY